MHQIHIIRVSEGEERAKGSEQIFEKKIAENFAHMEKKTVTKVQETQSPKQYKSKEEHTETHSNQTEKN